MGKKIIQPPGIPKPLAKYPPGVLAGNTLYVGGMLSMTAMGEVIGIGNIEVQTRHVLESIQAVVTEAGASMADVVHNAIFLKSFDDYQGMNKVYAEYFPTDPPARYCIRADLYKDDCLVEISTTAFVS